MSLEKELELTEDQNERVEVVMDYIQLGLLTPKQGLTLIADTLGEPLPEEYREELPPKYSNAYQYYDSFDT